MILKNGCSLESIGHVAPLEGLDEFLLPFDCICTTLNWQSSCFDEICDAGCQHSLPFCQNTSQLKLLSSLLLVDSIVNILPNSIFLFSVTPK